MTSRSPGGRTWAKRLRWSLYVVTAVLIPACGVACLTYRARATQASAASATAAQVERTTFTDQNLLSLCAAFSICAVHVGPGGRVELSQDPSDILGLFSSFSVNGREAIARLNGRADAALFGGHAFAAVFLSGRAVDLWQLVSPVFLGPDGRAVLGPDGRAVLGPDGRAVLVGPGGRVLRVGADIVGPDGRVAERVRADAAADAARRAKATVATVATATGLMALMCAVGMVVARWGASRGLASARRGGRGRAEGMWAQGVATGLIASAVRAVGHPEDQARYAEEWSADLAELVAGWRSLWWALGVRVFAPGGIRAARQAVPSAPLH